MLYNTLNNKSWFIIDFLFTIETNIFSWFWFIIRVLNKPTQRLPQSAINLLIINIYDNN